MLYSCVESNEGSPAVQLKRGNPLRKKGPDGVVHRISISNTTNTSNTHISEDTLMRQLLTLLAILLFTGANCLMAQTTYYVAPPPTGDDGNSGLVGLPKATIQAAINAASGGDIVEVAAGTYTEQIALNKAVEIRGANADIPAGNNPGVRTTESIIDGGFLVSAAATMNGLKIVNGRSSGSLKVGIAVSTNGVTVKNCIIQDVLTPAQSDGISTQTTNNNFTLLNSTIYNNWRGIYLNPGSGHTFTGNLIDANNGVGVGIGSDGQSNLTLTENTFSNQTLEDWGASAVGANVIASGNEFLSNAVNVKSIAHYSGSQIDARCNWWGSNLGPGSKVTGNVAVSPWIGVQLSVDATYNSLTAGWGSTHFDNIQGAINNACAMSIIIVEAGTYTGHVTINKDLELRGAKYGIDARDPSLRGGSSESLIEGSFKIEAPAADVTIDGFSFIANSGANELAIGGPYHSGVFGISDKIVLKNSIFNKAANTNGPFTNSSLVSVTSKDVILAKCVIDQYPDHTSDPNAAYIIIENGDASISDNTVTGALAVGANQSSKITLSGNTVLDARNEGIWFWPVHATAELTITGNTIVDYDAGNTGAKALKVVSKPTKINDKTLTYDMLDALESDNPDIATFHLQWIVGPVHNVTQDIFFTTITSAIAAANANDVINVGAGTYNENIVLDVDGIDLITSDAAILESNNTGVALLLKAKNLTIDGFEITKYENAIRSFGGPGVYDDLTIRNCHIHANTQNGITLLYDEYETVHIENCQILGNTQNGIGIANGATLKQLNIIETDIKYSGHHGIFINGSGTTIGTTTPTGMLVSKSIIQGKSSSPWSYSGITYDAGASLKNITINESSIMDNDINIVLRAAATNLDGFLIKDTEIKNSPSNHGIHLRDGSVSNMTLENVTISGNFNQGFQITDNATVTDLAIDGGSMTSNKWGFLTRASTLSNLLFDGVELKNNSAGSGLSLASGTVNGFTVKNCLFENNAWEHLDLGIGWIGVATLSNGLIQYNTFKSGAGTSIWIATNAVIDVNTIEVSQNNFLSGVHGVFNDGTSLLNAKNNWWGDITGPYHPTTNPHGKGDKVSDNVDYNPWLHQANEDEIVPAVFVYEFDTNGDNNIDVRLEFSTIPAEGGSIFVYRSHGDIPMNAPLLPPGAIAGIYLEISTTMPNYSFFVTITLSDLPTPFAVNPVIMYFNTASQQWIPLEGDYDAIAGTFTFSTNHFTAFAFADGNAAAEDYRNTAGTAYDLFVTGDPMVTGDNVIYPNNTWDLPTPLPAGYPSPAPDNDWGYTGSQAVSVYIVPEVDAEFGASYIDVQWTDDVLGSVSASYNGSIYDASLFATWETLAWTDRIRLDASLGNENFDDDLQTGDYIAKLDFELKRPGSSQIDIIGADLRWFGTNKQYYVWSQPTNATIKAYLGDVARPGTSSPDETSGDGKIDLHDLTVWSFAYWSGVPGYVNGMTNYKVKFDIGPTSTNYVDGLPEVDGKIEFEDLMIFAINYGRSASDNLLRNVPTPDVLRLAMTDATQSYGVSEVTLSLTDLPVDLRGLSLQLAGDFGTLLSVEYEGPTENVTVFHLQQSDRILVDLAALGGERGIAEAGKLLTLRFSGSAAIERITGLARDSRNREMQLQSLYAPVAGDITLSANYPNPFNPVTNISFTVPESMPVRLEVYDQLGRKVAVICDGMVSAGLHTLQWNGRDLHGQLMPSGMYVYRLSAGETVLHRSMILGK
jgi:hypothetical protein